MPMGNISKLMLSDEEQQLVKNSDWILTKRIIIEKVNQLLGNLSETQQVIIEREKCWLPQAVILSTPKIAKGENYLGLPYMLLDYPRCFNDADIFAIRTMFWWGNFFSVTLHVSGTYKQMFQQKILKNLPAAKQNFFICIHESPWHHHFQADNYVALKQLSVEKAEELIIKKQFIKLALKFSLQQWNTIPALLEKSAEEMIEMLKD